MTPGLSYRPAHNQKNNQRFLCTLFIRFLITCSLFFASTTATAQSNIVGVGAFSQRNIVPPSIEKISKVIVTNEGIIFCIGNDGTAYAIDQSNFIFPQNANFGVQTITSGYYSTAVLKKDGSIIAWGDNTYGECDVPASVQQTGVTTISGGFLFKSALQNNGTVIAWGDNRYGQCLGTDALGNPITTTPLGQPVQIGGQVLTGISAIDSDAWGHTVALKNTGQVIAWGSNSNGQCNVPLSALSGVTAIATGGSHSIALSGNGSVLVWGSNEYGQCDIPIDAQSGIVAIDGGRDHTVALKNNGSVVAWGAGTTKLQTGGAHFNEFGQSMVPDSAMGGVQSISAGKTSSLAIKHNGSIEMWGDRGPLSVASVETYTDIAHLALSGGVTTVLALKSNGSVIAWGPDFFGETIVPSELSQGGVTAIAMGGFWYFGCHNLALKDGRVHAWGNDASGQCTIPANALSGVTGISAGFGHSVALKNGGVLVWGDNYYSQCDVPSSALTGVVRIAAGGRHTSVLKNNGQVVAWGDNEWKQLNIPPEATSGGSGIVEIASGSWHALALRSNGSVLAWGDDSFNDQTIVPPEANSDVIAVAGGYSHSLALKRNGKVIAWGDNDTGQCNFPTGVYTSISAGNGMSYGILNQGSNPCDSASVAQTATVKVPSSYWRYAMAWLWPDGGARVPGSTSNVDLGEFVSIATDCAAQAGSFTLRTSSKLYVPIECFSTDCPGLGEPALSVTAQASLAGTLQVQITGDYTGATLPINLPPIAVLQAGSVNPNANTFDILVTVPPPPPGMFATLIPETVNGTTLFSLQLLTIQSNASLNNASGASASGVAISAEAIDFNDDGFDDIVLGVTGQTGLIQVLLNDGLGSLGGTSIIKTLPALPTSLAVGDFDGDGNRNDVVVGLTDGTVRTYFGNGSNFTDGVQVSIYPEIATCVCEIKPNGGNRLLNTSSGFGAGTSSGFLRTYGSNGGVGQNIPLSSVPRTVQGCDIDDEDLSDVTAAGSTSEAKLNGATTTTGFMQIIRGTPTGFIAETPFSILGEPVSMKVADIDGDGLPEIVTANKNPVPGAAGSVPPVFGLFRNVGGNFSGVVPIAPPSATSGLDLELVDVNNDGIKDMVAVYKTVGSMSEASLININTLGVGYPLSIGEATVISVNNPTLVARGNLDGNTSEDVFLVQQASRFSLTNDSSITPFLGVQSASCFGDLDGSGEVDSGDVSIVLLDTGSCAGCPTDLDGSGEVDSGDVSLVLLSTGACN